MTSGTDSNAKTPPENDDPQGSDIVSKLSASESYGTGFCPRCGMALSGGNWRTLLQAHLTLHAREDVPSRDTLDILRVGGQS